jgi:hypothetical protein
MTVGFTTHDVGIKTMCVYTAFISLSSDLSIRPRVFVGRSALGALAACAGSY